MLRKYFQTSCKWWNGNFNDPSVKKAVPMEVGVRNNSKGKQEKCHQHSTNNLGMGCLSGSEEMDEGDGDFQP